MKQFIEFARMFKGFQIGRKFGMTQSRGRDPNSFTEDIEVSLARAKIFRIDDSIKKLLLLTKVPKINDTIKLPFPYIFLDVSLTKEELADLGFDINYERVIGIMVREGVLITDKTSVPAGRGLRITIASDVIHNGRKEVWFDTFNENVNIIKEYKEYNLSVVRLDSADPKTRKTVHRFFLAFLNFINNPEVEIIETSYSKERNLKRVKKNKVPIPCSYSVRLNGVLKKYVSEMEESGHFKYSYRFWVRGHFRTLRDEERWGDNVGKRIWILPFVKGKGVLINKEYNLKKNQEAD